jgi:multidrug resistance efflux pump
VGGRIVHVGVAEGDRVEPGQVLIRLDDTLARAQLEIAQAGLEMARAQLARVRAGARPEQIRQAEAQLAQAEAARDGAYQAWQDGLAMIENPQELDAQIALAEAQLVQAEAQLRQAAALRDAAEIAKDGYDSAMEELEELKEELESIPAPFRPPLPGGQLGFHLIPNAYWRAWVGVNTAQAAYDGARRALNLLYEMRRNPQQLQAQVNAAEAQYRAAEAAVEMARARREGLRAGATEEEIEAAEAAVEQAQARVESGQVLLEKLTLTAPVGGRVLEVIGHEGELATPGGPLITLADLDQVMLTVYVPEDRLGQVQVGQRVEVRVDSFPDRVFLGRVVTIASEAEFTPRNIQTEEERVNMVFAVQVSIPNPDHGLKPGMPADAVILIQEQ